MFYKKTLLTLAVLGLVLTAGVGITSAFNGRWNGEDNSPVDRPVLSEEQRQTMQQNREAIQQAFENNDYEAWLALQENCPGECPMADKITAENFVQFAEMQQLMQSGDREGAQAIAEELGLKKFDFGPGPKMGMRKNFRMQDKNGDGYCDTSDLE